MKKTILGLGTAAIGRPHYINIKSQASPTEFDRASFEAHGISILDHAYQSGIRYFDTAPGYGLAEKLLIGWAANKKDNEFEIATKWGYTYVANFKADAEQHEVKEHSLAKLNEQWQQSENLLPYLTTYQIHSATFATGVLENEIVLNRLADLKTKQGIKMGITTTGADQAAVLAKALEVKINGKSLFDAFQVTYNVLDQSLAPLLRSPAAQGKRFIIKEALANGRIFPNRKFPHYHDLYQKLQYLAGKYGVGIDAVALRFCMDSVQPYVVLSGASEHQHLDQNLKANTFELDKSEVKMLEELSISPAAYWTERKALPWN